MEAHEFIKRHFSNCPYSSDSTRHTHDISLTLFNLFRIILKHNFFKILFAIFQIA